MRRADRPIRRPDRIASYFRPEAGVLAVVTVTGILYNVGMAAGPWFEGRLAQRLLEVLGGRAAWTDMLALALTYLAVILAVQGSRCLKRFYVRRFANDTARNMRRVLYNGLVHQSPADLEDAELGDVMTRAVADVDACAEGMRKFTTEIFDTGVVMVSYAVLLLSYDWRLALLSCLFTPPAYVLAGRMKRTVERYSSAYKHSAGALNGATLDRVSNALTYRVYGRERDRDAAYEGRLADYEHKAVLANIWEGAMQPLYQVIALCGVVPILYFGGKNVMGTGWTAWDIAAFTTFLSCFSKLALKASKAAKLFNSVQKARVSWDRVKPLMHEHISLPRGGGDPAESCGTVAVKDLSFAYSDGPEVLSNISFSAKPGEIVGVTGPVASGKSTLGAVFLCERPYRGSVTLGGEELSALSDCRRSRMVSYLGHAPQLMSGTVEENIRFGAAADAAPYLRRVLLEGEVAPDTAVGSGGAGLSGGQQARLALARTLYHGGGLLVLDDPFSAVDKRTEDALMTMLRDEGGARVTLLISHRLAHFPALDRIVYLEDGRATVGTHAELMAAAPGYARLYRDQTEGGDRHENA